MTLLPEYDGAVGGFRENVSERTHLSGEKTRALVAVEHDGVGRGGVGVSRRARVAKYLRRALP